MNKWTPTPEFEEQLRESFNIPDVNSEFVSRLQSRLGRMAASYSSQRQHSGKLRLAWSAVLILVALAILVTLVIGPQQVLAAVGKLFGYIPGIGIVDDDKEFRILAEPVSATRDGITLTVTNALSTPEKTVILYSIENVPWDALSHEESVIGCSSMAELVLPDGQVLQSGEGGGAMGQYRFLYPPLSADLDEVAFFLPCIFNTLPGKAPEDWELSLIFISAPADMDIIPVFEVENTPAPVPMPESDQFQPLSVTQVLDIGDDYVIFGEFDHAGLTERLNDESYWLSTETFALTDGNNEPIFYDFPTDIDFTAPSNPEVEMFAFRISKSFLPPLKIAFRGSLISKIGSPQEFTISFDAGDNPQPWQEWQVNQSLKIEGYETLLTTIVAYVDGYAFVFDHGENSDLYQSGSHSVSVENIEIEGYLPVGGGGGGGGGIGSLSLVYESIPKGKLAVILKAQLYQSSGKKEWTLQWSPEKANAELFGIRPQVDQWLLTDEGYILIGHNEWTDSRITNVSEYGDMKALDANGKELPLEKLTFAKTVTLIDNLQGHQWAYLLAEKSISNPVSLRLEKVNIEFAQPIRFDFDLRGYGFNFSDEQSGLGWKLGNQPLNIPGVVANLVKAKYLKDGAYSGFEFAVMGDSWLKSLALDFESGVSAETKPRVNRVDINDEYYTLLISVLTDGQLSMPIGMVAYGADIVGSWESTWFPALE